MNGEIGVERELWEGVMVGTLLRLVTVYAPNFIFTKHHFCQSCRLISVCPKFYLYICTNTSPVCPPGLSQCLPSTSPWTRAQRTRSSSQNPTTQPPTSRQRVWTSSPSTSGAPARTSTSARWSTTLGTRTCKQAGQVTLHLAGWSVLGGRTAAAAAAAEASSLFSRMPPPPPPPSSPCLPLPSLRHYSLQCGLQIVNFDLFLPQLLHQVTTTTRVVVFFSSHMFIYTKVR